MQYCFSIKKDKLESAHTQESSLRPTRNRSLCPATHSHPGTLGEAHGVWESVYSDLPTKGSHL